MTLFYDILSILCIIIAVLLTVILLYHRQRTENSWENRHKKLSLIFSLLFLLGAITIIYANVIEPKILITNYQTIDLKNIKKPIKIALISDLHVGDFNTKAEIQKITNRILDLNPDLVFIGGDSILSDHIEDDRLTRLEPLSQIVEKIPTFAVPGNHEYGVGGNYSDIRKRFRFPNRNKAVKEMMESLGINYLINQTEKITFNEQSFLLFGSDEYLTDNINFFSLEEKQKENPELDTIMLVHNPTAAFLIKGKNIDLMLSGHTHGGQVRLPFIGQIIKIEADIPRSWYQGLNEYMGAKIFVTSGANESGGRMRLFNPPEVVLLTIH